MSAHFTPFLSRSFSTLGKLRGVWGGMKFASEIALLQLHFDGFSAPPKCLANFPVAFLPKRIIIIIGWDDSCAGEKSQREEKVATASLSSFSFSSLSERDNWRRRENYGLKLTTTFFPTKSGKRKGALNLNSTLSLCRKYVLMGWGGWEEKKFRLLTIPKPRI